VLIRTTHEALTLQFLGSRSSKLLRFLLHTSYSVPQHLRCNHSYDTPPGSNFLLASCTSGNTQDNPLCFVSVWNSLWNQTGLKLTILSLQPSKCWDFRHASPCLIRK
ncbi:mCG145830, partial [Mus musculus]